MTYQRNETPEPLASATTTTEAFETGLRAEFEAWAKERGHPLCDVIPKYGPASSISDTTLRFSDIAWEAYRAATERAAKQEWQPIETAPMEGVVILVAGKGWAGTDYIVSAYYDEEHRGWWESNTHYTDATDGQVYPTYWMPLPDAPNAAAIRASSGKGESDV